jgi:antitoxin component of MazEF toxin-antitoxin module
MTVGKERIAIGGLVRIPTSMLIELGLHEGDEINLRATKRQITIVPARSLSRRKLLQQSLDRLSDAELEEMMEYLEFTTIPQKVEESFLWQQVEASQSYNARHPDQVFTVSVEDWDAVTQ